MILVLPGLVLLAAGAVLTFLVGGDLTVPGAVVMGLGAVLAVAGILRMRRRGKKRGYRTGTGKVIAMIAAVLYILSPIDIIPDPLLPVGVVDDAGALAWLVFAFAQEYRRRRVPAGGDPAVRG